MNLFSLKSLPMKKKIAVAAAAAVALLLAAFLLYRAFFRKTRSAGSRNGDRGKGEHPRSPR